MKKILPSFFFLSALLGTFAVNSIAVAEVATQVEAEEDEEETQKKEQR